MWFSAKKNPRRNHIRRGITGDKYSSLSQMANMDTFLNVLLWLIFVTFCVPILSMRLLVEKLFLQIIPLAVIVVLISVAMAIYIHHYQRRILRNHARAAALTGLFLILLAATRIGTVIGQPVAELGSVFKGRIPVSAGGVHSPIRTALPGWAFNSMYASPLSIAPSP